MVETGGTSPALLLSALVFLIILAAAILIGMLIYIVRARARAKTQVERSPAPSPAPPTVKAEPAASLPAAPEESEPLAGGSQLGVLDPELSEQVDLRGDEIAAGADRRPEHAVGKVGSDLDIAGQRGGEDGLADPALALEPHGSARDADRTVGCRQDGDTKIGQLGSGNER